MSDGSCNSQIHQKQPGGPFHWTTKHSQYQSKFPTADDTYSQTNATSGQEKQKKKDNKTQ